jgi:hydrophobic/amphiphilic exporter-1 (mainly G- bacteria), HAE1 family
MNISESAIRKPITAIMVALSVIVLGGISLFRLPLEYLPDVTFPRVYVEVSYPSSSPEEVEREISRPIEEALATLTRVKSISSSSYANRSSVRVEFDIDVNMDLVGIQVRDRLDQIRNLLPDDVERIDIRQINLEDLPILEYSVTWGGADPDELATVFTQVINPRLQRLEGVGSVEIQGMAERALFVEVDQGRLNAHGLDIRRLSNAIRSNNRNTSAGYVRDGGRRIAVRAMGEFEKVDEIRNLPLSDDIVVQDVADVTYDYPEKESFERLDGLDSVTLEIQKASKANMVTAAALVSAELDAIVAEIGADKLKLQLIRDRSTAVTDGIKGLSQSAMLGGLLAIGVIYLFLRNFRSTVIIGSAIPISALTVFLIMYAFRHFAGATITLNLISMMGLMVAIGMLVDPAVVALENIFRKRYDENLPAFRAAVSGAKEIGLPVVAASLTTICVFVPMIFITDSRNSMFMRDFAITVVISVLASLMVALTIIPLLASRAFGEMDEARIERVLKRSFGLLAAVVLSVGVFTYGPAESAAWFTGGTVWLLSGLGTLEWTAWVGLLVVLLMPAGLIWRIRKVGLRSFYEKIISSTLRYRWTTVSLACAALAGGFHVYGMIEKTPYRYQPTRRVDFSIEYPKNWDTADLLDLFLQVEEVLLPKKEELDIKAISSRKSRSSRFSTRVSTRLTLYLVDAEVGRWTTDEVKQQVTALLPTDIPGIRFKSGSGRGSSGGVGVEIKGRNQEILNMIAEDVEANMQGIPGVHDIESSLESGTEEIRVSIDRLRAQRLGLSPRMIATTVATALGTRGNSKFKTDTGEIDITVQLKEEDRATLEQLMNSSFESDQGTLVSFSSLANFAYENGPNTIRRDDRKSTVSIFANTESSARFRAGMQMTGRMNSVPLPRGYSWQMDRSFRWMQQEQNEGNFTMLFAALLIYIIMASLFESYVHPFTIMITIGFAFIGVAVGLYSFNVTMDSNASYGLLILFGIVVNNGIVFVDHINRYRREGYTRRRAIIQGGKDRLRPILMTATTTILGLAPLVVPMIYGQAEGNARRWGPIGLVVVCGLFASTILTLILLPTVYSLMDDLSIWIRRTIAAARASNTRTAT